MHFSQPTAATLFLSETNIELLSKKGAFDSRRSLAS